MSNHRARIPGDHRPITYRVAGQPVSTITQHQSTEV
jgi:hypothetical protein